MKNKSKKLWGGAFEKSPSSESIAFTVGRDVHSTNAADYELLPYDVLVNKAHALMLYKQKIINKKDVKIILKGLGEIQEMAEQDLFILDPNKEDVHTNIESWLTDKYGIEYAGKLHTARSRNDQANTNTALYLKDQVSSFALNLISLIDVLLLNAQKHKETIMPGFTHHQPAMITTFGHTLQAFASMLLRDVQRLLHWYDLHDFNPLGSVASYGTSFPIDREYTASLLGFKGPTNNSMDKIMNRWEAEADLAFAISVIMNHLSEIAQTFILMSTIQFGMITIADEFSTGSSVMPQKKNPDPLEIVKGKAAYVAGILQGLLSIGKASFIGFNRETQWTKYMIIDVINESLAVPMIMKGVIETLNVNKKQMAYWCSKGFIGATHFLEQLVVENDIPFRKAKVVVEKAVKYSKGEDQITLKAFQQAVKEENISLSLPEESIREWQNPHKIIGQLKSTGSPGINSFNQSYETLDKEKKQLQTIVQTKLDTRENSDKQIENEVAIILSA